MFIGKIDRNSPPGIKALASSNRIFLSHHVEIIGTFLDYIKNTNILYLLHKTDYFD